MDRSVSKHNSENDNEAYVMEACQNAHVFADLGGLLSAEKMALLHFDAGSLEEVEGCE